MHSAVAEQIHQSGEYQCSQKEATMGQILLGSGVIGELAGGPP
jgi:hypothetical protein